MNPIVAATQRQHETEVARIFRCLINSLGHTGRILASPGFARRSNGHSREQLEPRRHEPLWRHFSWLRTRQQPDVPDRGGTRVARPWRVADFRCEGMAILIPERPSPEAESVEMQEMVLASNLTRDQILDSFGTPSAVPIWELPAFIARLDAGRLPRGPEST